MIKSEWFNNLDSVKPLSEVVEFWDNRRKPVKEANRVPGEYAYYGANGQQGTIDGYLFEEPLILLAEDGGHFWDEEHISYIATGKYWVNNHAHVLKPKEGYDLSYLNHQLSRYDVSKFVTGTTRGKLTKTAAANIPIYCPPLPEQRRIAGILDKADAIRKQRRESLALADEFLKSTFLDMFGDPANNPKQWDVKPIGKYCTTAKKINPTRQPDIAFSYIDIGSVNCSAGTIEAAREILGIDAPSRARQKVLAGDVLVATVRPNLRGTAFVPNSLDGQICSTGFSVLRPDGKNINTEYLYSITRNIWFTNTLVAMCTGANYPAVRHSDVMRIDIPYPTIDLQNRFAEIVTKQRAMVSRSHAAEEEADNLFNSLVQRAFKGELS